MKPRIISMLLLLCFIVWGIGEAKRRKSRKPEVALSQGLDPEQVLEKARNLSGKIESDIENKVTQLHKDAEDVLKKIRQDVELRVKKLHKQAEEHSKSIKLDVGKETACLLEEAEKKANALSTRIEQKILFLKRDATSRISRILHKAEDDTLHARKQKHTKKIMVRVDSLWKPKKLVLKKEKDYLVLEKKPVTDVWKQSMRDEFKQDVSLVESIILGAEASENILDFMKCFGEQHLWFDNTLSSTRYEQDDSYKQIINKKAKIHALVTAQQQADKRLEKHAKLFHLRENDLKKARLLVLYDLNIAMQRRSRIKDAHLLSNLELDGIILSVLQETASKTGFMPLPDFEKLIAELQEKAKQRVELLGRENVILEVNNRVVGGQLDLVKSKLQLVQEKKRNLVARNEDQHKELLSHAIETRSLKDQVSNVKSKLQRVQEKKRNLVARNEDQHKELISHAIAARNLKDQVINIKDQHEKQLVRTELEHKNAMGRRLENQSRHHLYEHLDMKYRLTGTRHKLVALEKKSSRLATDLEAAHLESLRSKTDAAHAQERERDSRAQTQLALDREQLARKQLEQTDQLHKNVIGALGEHKKVLDEHKGDTIKALRDEQEKLNRLMTEFIEKSHKDAHDQKEQFTGQICGILEKNQQDIILLQKKQLEEQNKRDIERELDYRTKHIKKSTA